MQWGDKRYNNLNFYLKQKFDEKVYKLCLDGGFSCPNRDGTLSYDACIFCNEKGAGDFAGSRFLSISDQAEEQKILLANKCKSKKYIAYFQNFTNTYDSIPNLKKKYDEALAVDGVIGLAIATRPDCIDAKVMQLLREYNEKTFLWIELGLQTIDENSAMFINRGYKLKVFDEIVKQLAENDIKVVCHLIYGLPGENKEKMLKNIDYLNQKDIFGLKIHSLYITKETPLCDYYIKHTPKLLTKEEYIEIVVESISKLKKTVVLHRLSGDPDRATLYAPTWAKDKKSVLNGINKLLRAKDIWQGKDVR